MAKKSSIVGFIGIVLAMFGLTLITIGLASSMFIAVLGIFGLFLEPLLITIPFVTIILGIVFTYFGTKLFLENETAFIRLMTGILGVYLILLGVLLTLVGILGALPTGSLSLWMGIFALFILWSLGFSLVGYGFSIDGLKPMSKLISSFKSLLKIKR